MFPFDIYSRFVGLKLSREAGVREARPGSPWCIRGGRRPRSGWRPSRPSSDHPLLAVHKSQGFVSPARLGILWGWKYFPLQQEVHSTQLSARKIVKNRTCRVERNLQNQVTGEN